MLQLFLKGLDTLVEVFCVGLVVVLHFKALGFLFFQVSLQGSKALHQRALVFF